METYDFNCAGQTFRDGDVWHSAGMVKPGVNPSSSGPVTAAAALSCRAALATTTRRTRAVMYEDRDSIDEKEEVPVCVSDERVEWSGRVGVGIEMGVTANYILQTGQAIIISVTRSWGSPKLPK